MATVLVWWLLVSTMIGQGAAGSAAGGVPQPPPRDPRAKLAAGTGVISGRVTAADTGVPIRRANVSLSGASGQRATYTDHEGRYQFPNLPPGSYSVFVNAGVHRAGYQAIPYGANTSSSATVLRSKPIELADGQRIENIDVALPRTGVITGRVTGTDGEPASRVQVGAWIIRPGSEPSQTASAQTDDLGQFRLFGLIPGEYFVMANPSFGPQMGNQVETDAEPTGFAPTYAPGTPARGEAMRLRVGRGAEVPADIRLVETRVFSISGTVVNSRGEAQRNMSVMLMRSETGGPGGIGTSINPNGTFTIRNVPPGQYEIIARYMPPRADGSVVAGPDPNQELASVQVDVGTANVDGVVLMTKPGAVVTGEIVFDDAPPPGVRTNLFAQTTDRRPFMGMPQIELKENTFVLKSVFGPVLLRGSVPGGPNWGLKAVLLNGKDITDVPTTFTASDSGHLQVVFTSKAPGIEGSVMDDAGKPTMDATVLIFAQDTSAWQQPRSSYLRTTRVIKDGKYGISGLREGRYYAVAVPLDIAVSTVQPDAALLENLSKVATPVILNPGEKRSVDLTVVRIQQQ